MKLRLILIAFLVIWAGQLFAQTQLLDVLHLKDGTEVRGIIIEQIPMKTVKIRTVDQNIYIYNMDEIAKINKEEGVMAPPPKETTIKKAPKKPEREDPKPKGYLGITEIRMTANPSNAGNSSAQVIGFGFNTIQGYQFSPHFSSALGFGVGLRDDKTYFPIFIDLRAYFIKGKVKPFLQVAPGYSLLFNDPETSGSLFVDSAFGVKIFMNKKNAVNLSLGYGYHIVQPIDVEVADPPNYGLLALKLGMSF